MMDDRLPPAHYEGVYGYGDADPNTPNYRPFQSAPTEAAYRHQFGRAPTGIQPNNADLRQRQHFSRIANEGLALTDGPGNRLNASMVDYGTRFRDGPGFPRGPPPYNPGPHPPHSHMSRIGGDGHYYHSIRDYVNDLDRHADVNDHVRNARPDDDFPYALNRVSDVLDDDDDGYRLRRREKEARTQIKATRSAMDDRFAEMEYQAARRAAAFEEQAREDERRRRHFGL